MARVPYVAQESLPSDYQYLLDEDVLGERNVFMALANNPTVLQSFMRFGNTLWQEAGLERSQVEVVILSVARTVDSRYEWQQHVSLAREAGVSETAIDAIGRERYGDLDQTSEVIARFGSAVAAGSVDDALVEAVHAEYDSKIVVSLTVLASYYLATARIIDALGVELEDEFLGWNIDE